MKSLNIVIDGGDSSTDWFLEIEAGKTEKEAAILRDNIVRAVNAHEELVSIVKAIAESFNAGANQVYAEALAPHTDDETLKTWINKAIAKAEGK